MPKIKVNEVSVVEIDKNSIVDYDFQIVLKFDDNTGLATNFPQFEIVKQTVSNGQVVLCLKVNGHAKI